MKSILMLGWGYPPNIEGGLDIHVAEVLQELKEKEIEVKLALPEENCPDEDDFISLDPGDGDMIERSRKMSAEFVKIAKEFDIVHTHDWFGAEAGLKAKKYSDCRWISSLHSIGSDRSRNPCENIRRVERAAVEGADLSTCVSDLLADRIASNFDSRPKVVRNGFSEPERSGIDVRKRHGIGETENLILYVGRLAEQKSIELLVRSMEDLDGTLLIAGSGHRRGALEELAEILGVSDKVVFSGFVDEAELGDYYSYSDVFVSPSRSEPFGLTITEALTSNTPVVSTGSGAEELVDSGVISAERNSNSIGRAIQTCLKNSPEISYRERSWKEVAEDYLDIYHELDSSSTESTLAV